MNSASAQTHSTQEWQMWRTFHHDGKISPVTISTITCKVVVYAPAEWADILTLFLPYPYMYSVVSSSTMPHSTYVIHITKIYFFLTVWVLLHVLFSYFLIF